MLLPCLKHVLKKCMLSKVRNILPETLTGLFFFSATIRYWEYESLSRPFMQWLIDLFVQVWEGIISDRDRYITYKLSKSMDSKRDHIILMSVCMCVSAYVRARACVWVCECVRVCVCVCVRVRVWDYIHVYCFRVALAQLGWGVLHFNYCSTHFITKEKQKKKQKNKNESTPKQSMKSKTSIMWNVTVRCTQNSGLMFCKPLHLRLSRHC